jgi:hypothetical protein
VAAAAGAGGAAAAGPAAEEGVSHRLAIRQVTPPHYFAVSGAARLSASAVSECRRTSLTACHHR